VTFVEAAQIMNPLSVDQVERYAQLLQSHRDRKPSHTRRLHDRLQGQIQGLALTGPLDQLHYLFPTGVKPQHWCHELAIRFHHDGFVRRRHCQVNPYGAHYDLLSFLLHHHANTERH
jgi:hypothetical protein